MLGDHLSVGNHHATNNFGPEIFHPQGMVVGWISLVSLGLHKQRPFLQQIKNPWLRMKGWFFSNDGENFSMMVLKPLLGFVFFPGKFFFLVCLIALLRINRSFRPFGM